MDKARKRSLKTNGAALFGICRGGFFATLLLMGLCAGTVRGETIKLTPYDGTEATVHELCAGNAYTITVTSENKAFAITTNGEAVNATVLVQFAEKQEATLVLRNVHLASGGVPLTVKREGMLRIVSEVGASTVENTREGPALTITPKADTHVLTVAFSGKTHAPLTLIGKGGTNASGPTILSAPEIKGGRSVVRVEHGTLGLFAGSKQSEGKTLPPIIDAEEAAFLGGTTTVGFSLKDSGISASRVSGSLIETSDALTFSGGILKSDPSATPFPASGTLSSGVNTRYAYPTSAFSALHDLATGGQVDTTAYLRYQAEGLQPTPAHIVSGATDTHPKAMAIHSDRNVVAVDTETCPDPHFAFPTPSVAGAVELFGVTPEITEDGITATYAFGPIWIGAIATENGMKTALRIAVDLPQETATTRSFWLTIARTTDDASVTVYDGEALFTRLATDSIRYETSALLTADTITTLPIGSHAYRVTASALP